MLEQIQKRKLCFRILFIYLFISMSVYNVNAQNNTQLYKTLKETKGLVALWDFNEKEGCDRISNVNGDKLSLLEGETVIPRSNEGPLSGYSIYLSGNDYLSIPYEKTDLLNVQNNEVTVIAWIKREHKGIGFIAGMWNEHSDGGKRQYGLFISLPHYNGRDQVCGHISQTGKPTYPFPYSIDYSASKQKVPLDEWVCVAFTYDGEFIKSYVDGVLEYREPELINNTTGFEGYSKGLIQSKNPYHFPYGIGDNGSDFTVGGVYVKGQMGNFFKGKIGGLAVYDRALTENEVREIADK